jgi:hypothetical protein
MPSRATLVIVAIASGLVGCSPKNAAGDSGGNQVASGTGGSAGVHAGGLPGTSGAGGAAVDAGSGKGASMAGKGAGSAGQGGGAAGKAGGDGASAGMGGSGACPADVAIPALCKLCAGNTCGTPTCSGGKFSGFVCPPDGADAGTDVGGACNLACVKGKHCELKPTPTCVDNASDGGTAGAPPSCGGFAGLACPGMGQCVDVPGDSCDPMHGGADCPGQCECTVVMTCAPNMRWVGSPDVCACGPA